MAVEKIKNTQKYNELMRIFIYWCARHFRQDLKHFSYGTISLCVKNLYL